jgi:hypothetical protein
LCSIQTVFDSIVIDESFDVLILTATRDTPTSLQLPESLVQETEVGGIEDEVAGRARVGNGRIVRRKGDNDGTIFHCGFRDRVRDVAFEDGWRESSGVKG